MHPLSKLLSFFGVIAKSEKQREADLPNFCDPALYDWIIVLKIICAFPSKNSLEIQVISSFLQTDRKEVTYPALNVPCNEASQKS